MPRTTPPRPVDIAAVFPDLAPLARPAVRLHPRPGHPTVHDSSVGGPLLWPSDEPWPHCTKECAPTQDPITLEGERRARAVRDVAWARPRQPTGNILTVQEQTELEEAERRHPMHETSNALPPVAQIYVRDMPGMAGPAGKDLLQVLWCPLNHDDDEDCLPATHLVWRSYDDVEELLTEPPVPADVEWHGYYVPEVCVVHPEVVTEYPSPFALPEELCERLWAWSGQQKADVKHGDPYHQAEHAYYQYELSTAPGWKLGGWGSWSFCDPYPVTCATCSTAMEPLLTISSREWDAAGLSWIPTEDLPHAKTSRGPYSPSDFARITIGRGYDLQIYTCPESFEHPHQQVMQ